MGAYWRNFTLGIGRSGKNYGVSARNRGLLGAGIAPAILDAVERDKGAKPADGIVVGKQLVCPISGDLGLLAEAVVLSFALEDDNYTGMGDSSSNGEKVESDWQVTANLGGTHNRKAINYSGCSALEFLGVECCDRRTARGVPFAYYKSDEPDDYRASTFMS